MLLIKIFEWHSVGQEAITYANNEVGRNRQGTSLLTCAFICNQRIREMINVLTCRMHSTFLHLTLMISDQLCLSILTLYIATKKEVIRIETHH